MTSASPAIVDRTERNRYELAVGDDVAFLAYRRKPDHMLLVHTEVPEVFRGRGFGGLLAQHALDQARKEGVGVIVKCPFVTAWLRRHHEYDDIIVARIADGGAMDPQPPREPR